MTAELVALTAELKAVQLLLGQVLTRLDASDMRARELQESHRKLLRAMRLRRLGWVLTVVALVGLAWVARDAGRERSRLCAAQTKIVEALVSQAGPNPDAETQARIDRFRAEALVDCGG